MYISNLLNSMFGSSAKNNAKSTDTFVVVVAAVQFDSCLTACRTQDCISIGAQSFFYEMALVFASTRTTTTTKITMNDRPTDRMYERMSEWTKE